MNNSLKGALLSGVVFPGLGQIILKHYKRGIALMLTVLASLLVIVVKAVQQALTILGKINSEGGAIDMSTISNIATQASTTFDSLIFNFVLLLMIFCWVIGVVDAYRIGKKKDLEEQSTSRVTF
jgi:cbb3-type cytochrome oxidase subunit 3